MVNGAISIRTLDPWLFRHEYDLNSDIVLCLCEFLRILYKLKLHGSLCVTEVDCPYVCNIVATDYNEYSSINVRDFVVIRCFMIMSRSLE